VRLVNVHFTSRLGSDPLWGSKQPPADAGDGTRTAQAAAVSAYVNNSLASDPSLKLGVLGDFNGFYFENALGTLEAGGVLTDLHRLLGEEERYTYLFEGNLQAIDHMLVSGGLRFGAQFDAVHINAEFPSGAGRATDHDPILGRFFIEHPNEAPVAVADTVAVDEDGTTANLWDLLLRNDTDPDPEDTLTITSVDGRGSLGTLVFDTAKKSLVYVADDDAFDKLAPGEVFVDTFTYTITDPDGLTSTGTVSVTVTGIADGVTLDGGNGRDILVGTAGEDRINGGNGDDVLQGLGGHDALFGENGDDRLFGGDGNDLLAGGQGNDRLWGGAGADLFVFAKSGGNDVIEDFDAAIDRLLLTEGIGVRSHVVGDVNGDGVRDLTINFTGGAGSVVLLGVSEYSNAMFASADAGRDYLLA
jgi:VCBS repeat-containing protein